MDAKLVMFKSNGQRRDFPVSGPVTVIGRAEDCDLRVPLLSVSRRQCELRVAGSVLKAKDLASSNGTYVNNKRINEVVLKAGDRLVIGPIVFTVQIDGEPEEILPVKTRGQMLAESSHGEEEVVNLEADVLAQPGASSSSGSNEAIAIEEPTIDYDPIAALEALAGESEVEKKKNK